MTISQFEHSDLAILAGVFGNLISIIVYLAPVPIFHKIYKRKSSEGFPFLPYSVALFSATLYLYYALIKGHMVVLITINIIGCLFQSTYLVLFMVYAVQEAKVSIRKVLLGFNIVAVGAIVVSTHTFCSDPIRVTVVGLICSVFSICVFAAPLSVMKQVIRTKSVEAIPFPLSVCLTLCAVFWFFYGFFIRDFYIAAPNILGFALGVAQMVMYGIYKRGAKSGETETEGVE